MHKPKKHHHLMNIILEKVKKICLTINMIVLILHHACLKSMLNKNCAEIETFFLSFFEGKSLDLFYVIALAWARPLPLQRLWQDLKCMNLISVC